MTNESTIGITKEADIYLNSLVDDKKFSGSVLLAKEGEILLIKGYGCAEYVASKRRNHSSTVFRIGSVTKPFTATIILKLHELGKLDIKDALIRFLPDFNHGSRITIKHLLSHTSGLADYTEMSTFMDVLNQTLSIQKLIDTFKDEELQFSPGSQYSYSNSNYILLGYIIEKVTGRSYEANLREYILEPCNMNDTGYDCDLEQGHCSIFASPDNKRAACGYICTKDSQGVESCQYIDMSLARAAGGIYATVEDLYKFDRCLYDETILLEKTKKLMFKRVEDNMALGWKILELPHRRVCQSHEGEIFGFMSGIARFPKDNAFIAVLSNFENTPIERVMQDLTKILFEEKLEADQ